MFRSRCECTENLLCNCTTDLCQTVNKLKQEKKKQCQRTDVNVYVVYKLSTVETENTCVAM